MKALIWYLRGEYASFRPYYLTSIIDTYLFPPKTVIVGMIGAACGWKEEDLVEYYDKIKVGVKINKLDSIFNDLVKIWKVEHKERKIFVVNKRFLYKPHFTIYLATLENVKLINHIQNKLKDPIYPITLGDSDSLFYPENNYFAETVNIKDKPIKSRIFKCLVPKMSGGVVYRKARITDNLYKIYPKAVKMPIRFRKDRKVESIDVLYHCQGEIELKKEIEAYEFKGEPIYLF
jgi:CRISPR-associated protein Cas5 subtype I-B